MSGGGGLLYVQDGSSFTGVNVSFLNGTAVDSGGRANQGHLACANCTFQGNTAAGSFGPYGGSIFNHNIYGSVILESPKFIGNTPSVADDCSCAGYCAPGQCSEYCQQAGGGALKCCVCTYSGE